MSLREEIEQVIGEISSQDLDSLNRVQRRLRDMLAEHKKGKIEFHAVYRKDGAVVICDQDGRDFKAIDGDPTFRSGSTSQCTLLDITLVAPHVFDRTPRCEIKFSVPLEVEERMPGWMLENLEARHAW